MRSLIAVMILLVAGEAFAMREADRVRIAEARRVASEFTEVVWPGWSEAPFAILLVGEDTEYLLYHDAPSDDFTAAGFDDMLDSEVYTRDRVHNKGLQATFPAVGGVPCVVIGQAENTQAGVSTRWVLTVLHEHFHQWQQSQSDYYVATNALDLAGDDNSGMWMLNYPFPYDDKAVSEAFLLMGKRLRIALEAEDYNALTEAASDYLEARTAFTDMLDEKDYRYFSFQLWQEGVARYTELRVGKVAAGGYAPLKAFKALDDFVTYEETRNVAYNHILAALQKNELRGKGRPAFYALGAGEAMLLDRLGADWQKRYFTDKFYMEKYFPPELSR